GLYEVVVSSQFETSDTVGNGIACRQEQHGRLLSAAAQLRDHRPTIAAGQHDVKDEQVVIRTLGQVEPVVAILRKIRNVAVLGQTLAKIRGGLWLVFDDQNPHERMISTGIRSGSESASTGKARTPFQPLLNPEKLV